MILNTTYNKEGGIDMKNKMLKEKAHSLVKIAKEKGKITEYKDFLKTDLAKETTMTDKEISYYTSKEEEGK